MNQCFPHPENFKQVPNFDLQTDRPGAESVPAYFDETNRAVVEAVTQWEKDYDPEKATAFRAKRATGIANFGKHITREQAIYGTRQYGKNGSLGDVSDSVSFSVIQ